MRNAPAVLHRDDGDAADAERRAAEERSERLRFSLPLLILAGASLVLSYVLFHEALAPHTSRVPLWVLALSVGVIASAGGSASLLVGDFSGDAWLEEARSSDEYVVVPRDEWATLQAKARAARADPGPAPAAPKESTFELPVWEEPPALRDPSATPSVSADLSPPAPMSVSHGIDSLATEVERLVADLESAAAATAAAARSPKPKAAAAPEASATSPAVPTVTAPVGRNVETNLAAGPVASPTVGEVPRRAPAGGGPSPAAPRPTARPKTAPAAPATPAPRDDAEVEYRTLLAELEDRAVKARVRPKPEATSTAEASTLLPTDVRCVGCDARLGPNDRSEPCESCRSPMCPSCRDRSAKEGYRGLCAVCSILAESERRDSNRGR
jgi:hypothetical protein